MIPNPIRKIFEGGEVKIDAFGDEAEAGQLRNRLGILLGIQIKSNTYVQQKGVRIVFNLTAVPADKRAQVVNTLKKSPLAIYADLPSR